MKIRRFFESIESENHLSIINEYFSSFRDELDDICAFKIQKLNDNYFEVIINLKPNVTFDENQLTRLNSWITINELENKILKEIKLCINRLSDDQIFEEFEILKSYLLYRIKINTTIEENNIGDWIYLTPFIDIYYDKYRLKKILKSKFNIDNITSDIKIHEEYDLGVNLTFEIVFLDNIKESQMNEISDWMKTIVIDSAIGPIFVSSKSRPNKLIFDINYNITEVRE